MVESSAPTTGPEGARQRRSLWQWAPGLLISLVCIALLVRQVRFDLFWAALGRADLLLLAVTTIVGLLAFNVRALRWQIMLSPVKPAGHRVVYGPMMIGFFLNTVLPGRIGEFARAHVLARRQGLGFAPVFTTVVAERILDVLILAALALLVLAASPFEAEVRQKVCVVAGVAGALFVALVAAAFSRERFLSWLEYPLRLLPARWRPRAERVAASSLESLAFLRRPREAGLVLVLSVATWSVLVLHVMLSLWAMDLLHGWVVAGAVLVGSALGIAVPAAPSGVGTYELAVVMALRLFTVDTNDAAAYAVVLHLIQILPVCAIGVICMWGTTWIGQGIPRAAAEANTEEPQEKLQESTG